jgi:archaellum component FlaC
MDDLKELGEKHGKGFNWNLLALVGMFVLGNVFNVGSGWGGNNKDVANIQSSVTRIEASMNTLRLDFSLSDKNAYGEMKAMETHLTNTDRRVEELRSEVEELRIKNR